MNGVFKFRFEPGDYALEFVLPSGFEFTIRDTGLDDTLDSDADPTTGRTQVTSVAEAEDDLSWDAGCFGYRAGRPSLAR
jgi:hypothetical protein